MSPWPALRKLRIGCVRYLNAKPLIHGYDGPVRFEHPSQLAEDLASEELDAALVPIFEVLGERQYLLADGAAIASDGPVYSVFLAYRGRLEEVKTVALDPASLTSVHLLQVLLAEYYGLRPICRDARESGECDATLLIGNQAIEYRAKAPKDEQYLDLGEAWREKTGLPFVYAVWALRPGCPDVAEAAEEFRALKKIGMSHIAEIVGKDSLADADFRHRYLTEYIRFDLGTREKLGIELFQRLLVKHGFLATSQEALRFV